MFYVFSATAIGILALIAYLIFFRQPQSGSRLNTKEVSTPSPRDDAQVLTEWEKPLRQALEHIYAGSASTTSIQTQAAFEKPSASIVAELLNAARSFDRMGSLHASLSAVDNPNISMKELGDIVTLDPVLSARVLKAVNSPAFCLAQGVKSVHTGVTILGLTNLKNLIAFGALPDNLYTTANQRRMFKQIWRHMNTTAIVAAYMAKARRDMDSGPMYTAGLMHDIGKLILALRLPEDEFEYPRTPREEFRLFSTTHLYTGVLVAKNGFFPEQLLFLVQNHHQPAVFPVSQLHCNAEQAKQLTILFLANQIAKLITPDGGLSECMDGLEQLEPSYREILSKDEAREILLSPGLINDILINVRVVRAILN